MRIALDSNAAADRCKRSHRRTRKPRERIEVGPHRQTICLRSLSRANEKRIAPAIFLARRPDQRTDEFAPGPKHAFAVERIPPGDAPEEKPVKGRMRPEERFRATSQFVAQRAEQSHGNQIYLPGALAGKLLRQPVEIMAQLFRVTFHVTKRSQS